MSFSSSRAQDLTISRINRLLRPLRVKCRQLASFVSSVAGRSSTSAQETTAYNFPPLSVFPPVRHIGIKSLDKDGHELIRKIYAVRDAFKNVLDVACGNHPETGRGRIMGLSAMCASVIGDNVEKEVRARMDDMPEDGDLSVEDEEETETANELYESVPSHCRRWMLVSHTLSFTLMTCPHLPTLLSCLLDLTLSKNLPHQSKAILSALFLVACSPCSSTGSIVRSPPICHFAHSDYLTSLASRQSGLPLTTFTHLLLKVLVDVPSADAWTSKAVSRFARKVCKDEFPCFVEIVSALGVVIGQCIRKPNIIGDVSAHVDALKERVSRWIYTVLRHLLRAQVEEQGDQAEVIDFLLQFGSNILHHLGHTGEDDNILRSAFASLATFQLVKSSMSTTIAVSNIVSLSQILAYEYSMPATTTYDTLIARMVSTQEDIADLQILPCFAEYASALRAHALFALEASLWGSALRHVELMHKPSGGLDGIDEFEKMTDEVRERLEEAEFRCFGTRVGEDLVAPSPLTSQSLRSSSVCLEHRESMVSEWEWEEMVGCWRIKTSPARSSRLGSPVARNHPPSIDSGDIQQGALSSRSVLGKRRGRPVEEWKQCILPIHATSRTSLSSRRASRSKVQSDSEPENVPLLPISGRESTPERPSSRRHSTFRSILADAGRNRIAVHQSNDGAIAFKRATSPIEQSS